MLLPPDLLAAVETRLGSPADSVRRESGGCVNAAVSFESGGESYFLKWNERAPVGLFEAEADGLRTLRAAGPLAVPRVVAVAGEGAKCPAYLLLRHFGTAERRSDYWELLGSGLAALHRSTTPGFGHLRDNFIGTLPQENPRTISWIEFFAESRLIAQVRLGTSAGTLSRDCADAVGRLAARLSEWLPEAPESSCLHGDLWSGNVSVNHAGEPVIYDPALYYGHREVELAFTEFFGGFSPRFYAAYNSGWPLDAGYSERRDLYNLYPILVHANLFGGGYERQALATAKRYL